MSGADDALRALGLDPEEAVATDAMLRQRPGGGRDGRVCLCGHGAGRHTMASGIVLCKPARMECPCKKLRPVLVADDVRPFLRKTAGSGTMHALIRGLAALSVSGRSAEWTVDLVCDKCGSGDGVVPAAVTQGGVVVSDPTGYDALLCRECRGNG